ncbi:hypothetical protein [Mycobacterium spongiae]|uniref:Uncharacterized protein n=1 Tax=Mycobacterium spongiae TaxID=886343 RepID=A0A975K081_9MYCO|nr:hypothetical protein [Mycobacterium spongiae]QUR68643.1 hypothetical protein F6B93_17550 [Mycobacterium spongiae]
MSALCVRVIAEGGPANTGPDFGKASPLGLLVVVLLVIATSFLLRSMNRRLKKVPESFDRQHPEPDQAADAGTDIVGGAQESQGDDGDDGIESGRLPWSDDEPG